MVKLQLTSGGLALYRVRLATRGLLQRYRFEVCHLLERLEAFIDLFMRKTTHPICSELLTVE